MSEKSIVVRDTGTLNSRGQSSFMSDWKHRFVAFAGGWGAGKTWAGCEKLLALHCYNACREEVISVGGNDVVSLEPTFVSSAIVGLTFRSLWDTVVPTMLMALKRCGLGYELKKSDKEIVLTDFSRGMDLSLIYLRTAEDPERITGWEVGAFLCDEAARYKEDRRNPRNDPITQIRGRLRDGRAKKLQGLFTYTNEGAHTRVFEEFHASKSDHALYRGSTRDNPHVAESFVEDLVANLTPELQDQYIEGGAIDLRGGSVYSSFDKGEHVSSNVMLNERYPLAVMFDYNRDPGMHAYIGQFWSAEDRVVIVHEIHSRRMDIRGCVREIARAILQEGGIGRYDNSIDVYADATGNQEDAQGESDHVMTFQFLRHAIPNCDFHNKIPSHNPPVSTRVNTMNMAMKSVDGKSHYVHHSRCHRLTADYASLVWGDNGKIDDSDRERTHGSSAVGYFVSSVRPIFILNWDGSHRFGVVADGQ